jgi:hypothetical protein
MPRPPFQRSLLGSCLAVSQRSQTPALSPSTSLEHWTGARLLRMLLHALCCMHAYAPKCCVLQGLNWTPLEHHGP